MSPDLPRALQESDYERFAQEYSRGLSGQHFGEIVPQATQRKITVESLDLLSFRQPEVQVFSELSVQYTVRGRRAPREVVPNHMVVVTTKPVRPIKTYDLTQKPAPVRPFWVLDYVVPDNPRRDYDDDLDYYERELRVPYCLQFLLETLELTLYRHNKRKYVTVKPNPHGRYPIPDLDLEVGLLDGRVRYWYQGELLPLPADLQRDLDAARRQAEAARREAEAARREAEEEKGRADELRRRLEVVEKELAELRARRDTT
jgi:Uma2 family endonuclease